MDETTTSFVETAVKYNILIIGVVTALDSAGIQTSAVLASLGIVGLTIGFAARDAAQHAVSNAEDVCAVLGEGIDHNGIRWSVIGKQ